METKFSIAKDVTMSEEQLSDLLSMASDYSVGFDYWAHYDNLNMNGNNGYRNYRAARASLEAEGIDSEKICLEQVWARMLFTGKSLYLLEAEGDADERSCWYEITLENIIKGIKMYFEGEYSDNIVSFEDLINNGDGEDADTVFQLAVYGKVVFG